MDPASIVACVSAALGITVKLGKIIKFLTNVSTQFRFAEARIVMLIGYLKTLKATLKLLQARLEKYDINDDTQELVNLTESTLSATEVNLAFLETSLEPLQKQYDQGLNVIDKLKFLLKSEEFNSYLDGIDRFVNALNLQLQALNMPDPVQRQALLQDQSARTIFRSMQDTTSSMLGIADRRASVLSRQSTVSEASNTIDRNFTFDADVLNSRIYAITYVRHIRRDLRSNEPVAKDKRLPAPPLEAQTKQDPSKSEALVFPSSSVQNHTRRKDIAELDPTALVKASLQSQLVPWSGSEYGAILRGMAALRERPVKVSSEKERAGREQDALENANSTDMQKPEAEIQEEKRKDILSSFTEQFVSRARSPEDYPLEYFWPARPRPDRIHKDRRTEEERLDLTWGDSVGSLLRGDEDEEEDD